MTKIFFYLTAAAGVADGITTNASYPLIVFSSSGLFISRFLFRTAALIFSRSMKVQSLSEHF
ncbi:MAG: hypothetical protein WDN75_07890 [Bacteroidota bacterium]